MVDINSIIDFEVERFHRKNSLEALQLVLSHFHNIKGVAVVHASYHATVEDGLCISIEVNVHELDNREKEVLALLGLEVPVLNRFGDEIEVDRLNFDRNDLKKLKNI